MPAGNTYESISSVTLTNASSSVTFGSIPQTYTDLVLVSNFKGSLQGNNFTLQFNSDTGNNYSRTFLYGNGSSASSGRTSNTDLLYIGQSDSAQFMNNICHIMNYSNSTTFKSLLSRTNDTAGLYASTGLVVSLWRSTAAVTSILVRTGSGDLASGSTFSLYGIKAA